MYNFTLFENLLLIISFNSLYMNRPTLKRSTAFSMAPRPHVFEESQPGREKIIRPVPSRFN